MTVVVTLIWQPGNPLVRHSRDQMAAGGAFMDSLTEKDFPAWIERTEKLLSEHGPGTRTIERPIPPDLSKLKIISIYVREHDVSYMWMGAIDHTALHVSRLEDGSFRFVAQYNDAQSKVIWPKD